MAQDFFRSKTLDIRPALNEEEMEKRGGVGNILTRQEAIQAVLGQLTDQRGQAIIPRAATIAIEGTGEVYRVTGTSPTDFRLEFLGSGKTGDQAGNKFGGSRTVISKQDLDILQGKGQPIPIESINTKKQEEATEYQKFFQEQKKQGKVVPASFSSAAIKAQQPARFGSAATQTPPSQLTGNDDALVTVYDKNGNSVTVTEKSAKENFLPSGKYFLEQPKPQETVLNQVIPEQVLNEKTLPPEILNDPAYKNATPEQKQLLALTYNTTQARTAEESKLAQESLQEAIKLVDPYFREQIRIAQDQIQRSVGSVTQDAQTQVNSLQERVKQIQDDLSFNRNQLSLEQQAELSQQLQENQIQLETLHQNYAEAGLIFSSPRELAEQRLKDTQQGIAESSARRYGRSLRELEVGGQRQLQESAQQIASTERQKQERLTDISRQGESALGTKNVPTVTGVQPLGEITGGLEEDRQNAILNLENVLLGSKLPPSTIGLLKF